MNSQQKLSTGDIENLAKHLASDHIINCQLAILEWASKQSLGNTPNISIADDHIEDLAELLRKYDNDKNLMIDVLQTWRSRNNFKPEEVIVGITEDQHYAIAQLFSNDPDEFSDNVGILRDYMATQSFERRSEFEPGWDNIPDGVDSVDIEMRYFSGGVDLDNTQFLMSYPRPVPNKPIGEGQVWSYNNTKKEYTIIALGDYTNDMDGNGFPDWLDSVTYQCNENKSYFTLPLEVFLTKFKWLHDSVPNSIVN